MSIDSRVQKALDLLESAAARMHDAAMTLSGVPGFSDDSEACNTERQMIEVMHGLVRQTEQARKAKEGGSMVKT